MVLSWNKLRSLNTFQPRPPSVLDARSSCASLFTDNLAMNHLLIVDDNPEHRELACRLATQSASLYAEFASNGIEALEHLESATPLVVLTDLQMPEMDGLQLVRIMRHRYPTIPVVLMTAHGDEDIALEALVSGAADFISKHRLTLDLHHVLESVLGAVSGNHRHEELNRRLRYKRLSYSIESDERLIAPLVDQLQQSASELGLIDRSEGVRMARCLAEALRNAIVHGGARDDARETERLVEALCVDVTAEFTNESASFVIRDYGPGFDPNSIVDPRQAPQCLLDNAGRGLTLIRLMMDEVSFNETGNEITLIKRKPSPCLPAKCKPEVASVQHANGDVVVMELDEVQVVPGSRTSEFVEHVASPGEDSAVFRTKKAK